VSGGLRRIRPIAEAPIGVYLRRTASADKRSGRSKPIEHETSAPGRPKREGGMVPLYLSKFSYTPETWARLIANPEDRSKAARSYIESVGGKLHGFWYAFGEHDGYTLWEAPDNVSLAAVALAIGAGGAVTGLETTVLMSVEDTLDALGKASQIQYKKPGA
jgi:uncharacterized protein with GYD domain